MSEEQECACDDLVLQSGFDRADYAEALSQTARCANSGFMAGCPMTNRLGVRARVVRILTAANTPAQSTVGRMPKGVFAGLLFAFVAAGSLGAEHIYSVGGDVTGPAVIHQIQPRYTDAAKRAKLQGTVHLKLVVDSSGLARDIVVMQGIDSGLAENARQALRRWRFRPATRNAKPVAVRAKIDVNIRLR